MPLDPEHLPDGTEQRWRLAIAGSNDGVWDWDLTTNMVFFSDRWKSMLGYLPEDIGVSLDEWRHRVHPDDLGWVTQVIERHLAGKDEFYQVEHRMRHKAGHYLWILDRGRVQYDNTGRPVRMTGMHTDVTERHQAQEQVQNLSQELATILELSPEGFLAFDANGHIKYVTTAFEAMTGLPVGQLQGLDEDQFWSLLAQRCLRQSRLGHVADVRHNLSLPDNQRRSLLELTQPIGRVLQVDQRESRSSSRVQRILCFRDVSYESEVERLKSEFMATAAHELRTPLASIYGFAEILLAGEMDAAARKEFTEIIHQQSQAMTELLNEILDLARIEDRRQADFVFTQVDARQLVKQVLEAFRLPAGRKIALLEAAQADLQVRVDVKKANQVILNVLSNAYKYSPAGGAVTIGVERITRAEAPPEVAIHITDQGLGMTPEQQMRVFERFYRAHPASRIPGTGLGMSIVKEIMALLDGRVVLQSAPGQGTRVSLFFPVVQGG